MWGDEFQPPERKKRPKKKRSESSGSNSSRMSCDETEMDAIKADMRTIKGYLRIIRVTSSQLPNGIRGWFDHFDTDRSDEIEFAEFVKMIEFIGLQLGEERLGIMLYRIFDRRFQGFFNYQEFADILEKRMKPSYKKIIWAERARWALEGLNLNFPPRKRGDPVVVFKDRIKEVPVIKEVDKPVYIDKIKYVDKPQIVYQDKVVEKVVYVD